MQARFVMPKFPSTGTAEDYPVRMSETFVFLGGYSCRCTKQRQLWNFKVWKKAILSEHRPEKRAFNSWSILVPPELRVLEISGAHNLNYVITAPPLFRLKKLHRRFVLALHLRFFEFLVYGYHLALISSESMHRRGNERRTLPAYILCNMYNVRILQRLLVESFLDVMPRVRNIRDKTSKMPSIHIVDHKSYEMRGVDIISPSRSTQETKA